VRIVAEQAHPGSIRKMRVEERVRLMTIKTRDALCGLENDISGIFPVVDAVAGSAPQRDSRMNMISRGVIGVTLQAV